MSRPRIMLDVRFFHSRKIVDLPNRHKLGWIWTLMEAKQQDREGVFPSRASLLLSAGTFRDGVAVWLEAGLLHYIEGACDKCREVFGDVEDGSIVVHDWHDYQVSRTTAWRDERGVGKQGLQQPRNVGETPGETEVKHPSRGRARASGSRSSSGDSVEGGVGGSGISAEEGELFSLIARSGTAIAPESGLGKRLLGLMDRRGVIAVMAAARGFADGDRLSDRQWTFGLEDALEPTKRRETGKGFGPGAGEAERAFGG